MVEVVQFYLSFPSLHNMYDCILSIKKNRCFTKKSNWIDICVCWKIQLNSMNMKNYTLWRRSITKIPRFKWRMPWPCWNYSIFNNMHCTVHWTHWNWKCNLYTHNRQRFIFGMCRYYIWTWFLHYSRCDIAIESMVLYVKIISNKWENMIFENKLSLNWNLFISQYKLWSNWNANYITNIQHTGTKQRLILLCSFIKCIILGNVNGICCQNEK